MALLSILHYIYHKCLSIHSPVDIDHISYTMNYEITFKDVLKWVKKHSCIVFVFTWVYLHSLEQVASQPFGAHLICLCLKMIDQTNINR